MQELCSFFKQTQNVHVQVYIQQEFFVLRIGVPLRRVRLLAKARFNDLMFPVTPIVPALSIRDRFSIKNELSSRITIVSALDFSACLRHLRHKISQRNSQLNMFQILTRFQKR